MSVPSVLIFARSRSQAEILAAALGVPCIHGDTGPLALRKAIVELAQPGTIVASPAMAHGWRAPVGTTVLFQEGFPSDRERQAQARVSGRSISDLEACDD